MRILYKEPKPLMNDLLFENFKHNQYFKFADFANKVKAAQTKYPIDYDMMKDFIYEMIDQKMIEQVYVNENENPFLPENRKVNATNKSIHFKIIATEQ